jgi:hypothetical protein
MSDTTLSEADASSAPTPLRSFLTDPSVLLLAATVVVAAVLLPFQLSNAFGLPAHPLLLHVPVVLVPVLSVVTVALAVRPAWRLRFGLSAGVLAIVTMAGTILTAGAGEALKKQQDSRPKGGGMPGQGGRMPGQGGAMPGQGGAMPGQGGGMPGQGGRMPGQGGGMPGQGGGNQSESAQLTQHANLGSELRILVILLAVVLIILVILERYRAIASTGFLSRPLPATAVAAVVAVIAVVSLIWVIRTGHAGAEMTWGQKGTRPPG